MANLPVGIEHEGIVGGAGDGLHDLASRSLVRESGAAAGPGVATGAAGAHAPDPLSDVLRAVRLTGALFFVWNVSSPHSTPVPTGRAFAPIILPGAQRIASYHVVTKGTCWGALIGEPPVRLEAGDVLLVPHGDAYVIASSAGACEAARFDMEPSMRFFRQMAAGELPFVVDQGGGGPDSTRLICGFLGCDTRPINPVLAALPRLVCIRSDAGTGRDRLQSLIDCALAEARHGRPGGQCVVLRLSELMFVEVVRRWLFADDADRDGPPPSAGWLAALRDPLVGRALACLHEDPASAWTIAALADRTGSSRSRLAASFTRLVGQPPMHYLTQWRLQLAARMLADGGTKVCAVAADVGFRSEAAFSRAFKRFAGVSPARWRQVHKA